MADNQQSDREWLAKVIEDANRGDERALQQLRVFLDDNPQVWQHVGDLAKTAEHAWVAVISNGDSFASETLKRQLHHLRSELLTDSECVIERMLADCVVSTWLELHYLRSKDADTSGRSAGATNQMVKRLESAQRRHTNAMRQFVQIRKLFPGKEATPVLRIFPRDEKTA